MGKGLEQLFLQRKYTNGHGPYEKVLNKKLTVKKKIAVCFGPKKLRI